MSAPLVVIFMGSSSDSAHAEKIEKSVKQFGINCEMRISSAHKTPARLLEIIKKYEAKSMPKVYITVAGRSNALSGFADANCTTPVIVCPPPSETFAGADLFSSIRMPSGVCPMLVLDPANAGLAAAKIFAINDAAIREKIAAFQTENVQKLYVADAELRTKSYVPLIDSCRANTLQSTDTASFNPTNLYIGKVRDRFEVDNKVVLSTTDRLSGFDRILCSVPFKGQVLNLTSAWWFKQTEHIIPNHVLSVPDANVTIGMKCTPFPIEFVVRGYITGSTSTSMWTNYANGVRNYCGIQLPEGLVKNQKLWENMITPTTKSDVHDELIGLKEIVSRGIMSQEDLDYCAEKALEIFNFGQKVARDHGLLLVDTKYEFGKDENGQIRLIDEIHTPDSSRYWIASTYAQRMAEGKNPDNIDKEFVRSWFREHCDPYKDEVLPEAPAELVNELSRRYIELYELITGEDFDFSYMKVEAKKRIHDAIANSL
ncbi:hypothetical protein WA158_007894 [Blastocystis sp. Blastoise]